MQSTNESFMSNNNDGDSANPRNCFNCNTNLRITKFKLKYVQWSTNEFCSIECLECHFNWLKELNNCTVCHAGVKLEDKIKYTIQFGSDKEQFCSAKCLSTFKSLNTFCKLCQERIKSFMLISENEKFCSPFCVSRYSGQGINQNEFINMNKCHMCEKFDVHHLELLIESVSIFFCSAKCVSKYHNENAPINYMCACCGCLLNSVFLKFYKGIDLKVFCSRQCWSIDTLLSNEIIDCPQCESRKFSADMIGLVTDTSEHETTYVCSISCSKAYVKSRYL